MNTNGLQLRIGMLCALVGWVNCASACSICTSNLTYNYAKFTAVWFGAFIIWLAGLWMIRWYHRSDKDVAPAFKAYVRAFSRYAIFLILLGVIVGAHLGAVLLFPLLLLIQWVKHSRTIKASNTNLWAQLKYANVVIAAFLLLAIPAGYYLPPVVSEVETRQRQQEVIKSMRKVLDAENRKIAAASAVDPYNYEVYDLPLYKLLMQGMLFYRPKEAAGFNVTEVNGKTVVYSRGPNGDFDLSPELISEMMGETSDTARLAPYTYDATNGMIGTAGDIWVAR